jgi:hypothetical protein
MNDILKLIADNQALFEAVRTLIREPFEKLEYPSTATNEYIGQITRAKIQGLQLVEEGFKKIATFKSSPDKPVTTNPAR